MEFTTEITSFKCPKCSALLEPEAEGDTLCPACSWRGQVHLFRPLAAQALEAEEALPEDAACAHHPTKRAVAVCEGSGDYICSLCAVELEGKTYSVQFLDSGGRDKLKKIGQKYLPRPDREVGLYLLVSVLPPFWFLAVFLVPLAFFRIVKCFRLRKDNPVFRRVMSHWRIVLGCVAVIGVLGLFASLLFAIVFS